jgi:orotate phosphoribosyltransferase
MRHACVYRCSTPRPAGAVLLTPAARSAPPGQLYGRLVRARDDTPAAVAAAFDRSGLPVLIVPDEDTAAAIRVHTRRPVVTSPAAAEEMQPRMKHGLNTDETGKEGPSVSATSAFHPCSSRVSSVAKPPSSPLRWISRAQLAADAPRLLGSLPWPLRGIAGIPRSGLRVAAQLADLAQCPLAELSRGGVLRWLGWGARLDHERHHYDRGPLVIVEDSAYTGASLFQTVDRARRLNELPADVLTAAVYVADCCPRRPDLFVERLPAPFLIEGHVFGSRFAAVTGFDFDGVLCRNPTLQEVQDESAYRRFLATSEPRSLVRPIPAGLIATARSHTRAAPTEAWLARYGVRTIATAYAPWDEIIRPNHREDAAAVKARALLARPHLRWFVESDPTEARLISDLTRRSVICYETGEVFGGEFTRSL